MRNYKIAVAKYKNSKSTFASFIRFQQTYLQRIPWDHWKYSHTEIYFYPVEDNEIIREIRSIGTAHWLNNESLSIDKRQDKFLERWIFFSSSEIDNWTRFKFILDNKWNWDYDIFVITRDEYLSALKYCKENDWKPYGWTSIIFTQVLKTLWFVRRENPFCSQITIQVLQQCLHLYCGYNSIEINPGKLSNIIFEDRRR